MVVMKKSFCYISLVCFLNSSILGNHIGAYYEEIPSGLCVALHSIIQQNVLTPPLSIQSRYGSFDHRCINASSNNVTIMINLTTNITQLISKSSVIIVETKTDVLANNMTHLMNHRSNHLIVLRRFIPGDIDELAYQCWKNLLVNVSFLTNDDVDSESVLLQTFEPFNEANCNDTMLRTINVFNQKTRTWHSKNFFPIKLTNLRGCTLRIAMHESAIPFIMREEIINGERVLKGRAFQIVKALSRSLNFSTDVIYNSSINGYITCLERVTNNEAEMFIGNVLIDRTNVELMDFTFPIFFEHLKFIVPPGRTYTQAENLARVFDLITWTLILIVFLLFGGTIIFISFQTRKVKMYAFGAQYSNVFMDYLATIFGLGVSTSPNAHLPRFFIMKFVFLCFIMRSIYQGSLYNFLQSGARTKPVQSMDEMISKEFTFFMVRPYDVYLDQTPKNFARKKFITISDFDEILEKISDPNFKGSLLHHTTIIKYKNSLPNRVRNQSIFCKEYLTSQMMVPYLRKNFYLTEIVNEKMQIFHAAGLIDAWDRLSKTTIQRPVDVDHDRKPITLENLEFIFIVYLCACGAGVMCCCAEMISQFLKHFLFRVEIP